MRRIVVRSVVVVAAMIVGWSGLTGVASAVPAGVVLAYGSDELHVNEMPEQKTDSLTCSILQRQGSSGYAMLNRDGVSRVYEYAGWSSDPQGYIDMRVNVYEDGGSWLTPGGWSKEELLGFTFIGCS